MFLNLIILFMLVIPVYATEQGSEVGLSVQVDGLKRQYLLFSPKQKVQTQVPLMVVLHGGTGNAQHSSLTMGMNQIAIENGFFVAYPDGTGTALGENRRVWNAGRCCAVAARKNINDVKFIAAMIAELVRNYPIDRRRIYVTGESNGAMLTYRLMCELPHVFAAAIAVSGTLMTDTCQQGQDTAFFDIHGSADSSVPYTGGRGQGLSAAVFRSVPDSLALIAKLRKCAKPVRKVFANGDIDETYVCAEGAPMRSLLIQGGGHAWPLPDKTKGTSFSAPAEVWRFAEAFHREP